MLIPSNLDPNESPRLTTHRSCLYLLITPRYCDHVQITVFQSTQSSNWALQNPNSICYLLLFLFLQNVLVQNNASSLLSKLTNNKYLWLQGWTNFPENGERYFIFVILIFHQVIFLLKANLLLGSKSRAMKNLI